MTPEEKARRQLLIKVASAVGFLAIVAVAVLIVVSQSQTDGGDTQLEGAAEVNAKLRGIPQQGLVLGDPRTQTTLVEFGDLQCPACAAFAKEVIPPVIESKVRSGQARLEFRNFVILGDESTDAAAAAVAAGEQGRGWNFIEIFYGNQGFEHSGYITDDFMTAVAEAAGVPDIATWNTDRRSGRVLAEVSRTTEEAKRLGLGSTPSFAVQGPRTNGLEVLEFPESAGDLEAAVDQAG